LLWVEISGILEDSKEVRGKVGIAQKNSNSGNKFELAMPTTDISVGKATLREQQRR
jgi:hypothetical protein